MKTIILGLLLLTGCSFKYESEPTSAISEQACEGIAEVLEGTAIVNLGSETPCKVKIESRLYYFYDSREFGAIKTALKLIINRDKIKLLNKCYEDLKVSYEKTNGAINTHNGVLIMEKCHKKYNAMDRFSNERNGKTLTIRAFKEK